MLCRSSIGNLRKRMSFSTQDPITASKIKVETAKNFYYTAENSSTTPEFVEESLEVVDKLLRYNGYKNPRDLRTSKQCVSSVYDKDKGHYLGAFKAPVHVGGYLETDCKVC